MHTKFVDNETEYDGNICPACHERGCITGGDIGMGPIDCIYRKCECNKCGATWEETFELSGFRNLAGKQGIGIKPGAEKK